MNKKSKSSVSLTLLGFALALPGFIGLGFIVGCHDEMASVGYVSGPSFIPFEGVFNAFEEYGMPGARKGASLAFYIWFGLISLWVISLLIFRKPPNPPRETP